MTTKLIQFTQEQKSLIWQTKVSPNNGDEAETKAFIEVCEEYGLNPLLGDITFSKFETKYGPKVSYLISRDAYLKYAMRQDDFKNILSGVVKEGDLFELDVVEGVPKHKFGEKRGKIIGAWAVVKSKSRGNTVTFADFDEYYQARNSKNPVWRDMPSAMIEKVAQSTALRRTFPLGVMFSGEEEVGAVNEVEAPVVDLDQPTKEEPAEKEQQDKEKKQDLADELKQAREEKKKEKKPTNQTKKQNKSEPKVEAETTSSDESAAVKEVETSPKTEPEKEQEKVEENPVEPVTESVAAEPNQEEVESNTETVNEPTPADAEQPVSSPEGATDAKADLFEFVKATKREGSQGIQFLDVFYKENGETKRAFVQGKVIEAFDEFDSGQKFHAELYNQAGFDFVSSVTAV